MAIIALNGAAVCVEPFPHLTAWPALPPEQFEVFRAALPPAESFSLRGRGLKLELDIAEGNPQFDGLPAFQRQRLIELRTTLRESADALAACFAGALHAKYEWLLGESVAQEVLAAGWTTTNGRVMGRAAGYELPPHLDSAHFGVTCLLYFSESLTPDDGALSLYRPARDLQVLDASTYYPERAEGIRTELAKTIAVRPNLFVAFVCGPQSVHGFSRNAQAQGWRFVYQCHVMPCNFRIADVADRLSDSHRSRWLRVLGKMPA